MGDLFDVCLKAKRRRLYDLGWKAKEGPRKSTLDWERPAALGGGTLSEEEAFLYLDRLDREVTQ